MRSSLIKLDPITTSAAEKIRKYSNIWKVVQQVDNPDFYFFQSFEPHMYIVPVPNVTRNPKENLGENYSPPNDAANTGAMWIRVKNDPSFEYAEYSLDKRKAA